MENKQGVVPLMSGTEQLVQTYGFEAVLQTLEQLALSYARQTAVRDDPYSAAIWLRVVEQLVAVDTYRPAPELVGRVAKVFGTKESKS